MPKEMTGYTPELRFYASRFKQGKRTVYSIELPLRAVVDIIPRPDPNRLTEGNRRINDAHARGFGDYVREKPDWIAPALLLRASDVFKFESQEDIAGIHFGTLTVPRIQKGDLRILDGQHRILGLHHAADGIATDLEKKKNLVSAARKQGHPELVQRHEAEIRRLEEQRSRFEREQIAVQIYVEDEAEAFKQMFVDIADNALGITSTIRARFDHRKVVNRALDTVLDHALLKDRVDFQQDRIAPASPFLMGAKHAADIIRTVQVGISGRISRRQEEELKEADLAEKTNNFLDVLVSSFQPLGDVADGKTSPERLRKTSLLASTTMLRVLAGVYNELAKDVPDEVAGEFFAKLSPFMSAPVRKDSPWLQIGGEIFSEGASAPKARYQDKELLTNTITRWYKTEPAWIKAA